MRCVCVAGNGGTAENSERGAQADCAVNHTRDFAVAKLPRTLEKIKEIGFQPNRRTPRVQRLSHDCTPQTVVAGRTRRRARPGPPPRSS